MDPTKEPERPRTAAEVCRCFEPGEIAQKLLRNHPEPGDFFRQLLQQDQFNDAVRFAAFYLPRPVAIRWANRCLWLIYRPEPPPPIDAVHKAIFNWGVEPTEEKRRAVEAAGRAVGVATPAGCLAMAVFRSGGSIAPVGAPEVDPPAEALAKGVAGAVQLAIGQIRNKDQRRLLVRQFLALAQELDEHLAGRTRDGG